MAVPYALTTLDSVKTYLGITNTDDDVLIDELIDNVTEWVEGQMGGRRILLTSYVDEEHDGGEQDVFLFNWPIASSPVLTGSFRTGPVSDPQFKDFDVDDFVVYLKSGFVHFFARTPGDGTFGFRDITAKGSLNLRFTYDAGFAEIPDDIELVAKQLVAILFQRRNAQGIKKETIEGSSIEYRSVGDENDGLSEDGLTGSQQAVINRYKRQNVGQNF